mmetsp:Transcript_16314/g.44950  ORF Transcript_16314/g.44950 Transcript_16314/m.44950 type:complete len:197 (-) Transcript_16314:262-852(-)
MTSPAEATEELAGPQQPHEQDENGSDTCSLFDGLVADLATALEMEEKQPERAEPPLAEVPEASCASQHGRHQELLERLLHLCASELAHTTPNSGVPVKQSHAECHVVSAPDRSDTALQEAGSTPQMDPLLHANTGSQQRVLRDAGRGLAVGCAHQEQESAKEGPTITSETTSQLQLTLLERLMGDNVRHQRGPTVH